MIHRDRPTQYAYGIIREEYILENETRVSYGIAAYAQSEDCGTASVAVAVRDITADKAAAEALAERCNRLLLSPVHLADVAEDFFEL